MVVGIAYHDAPRRLESREGGRLLGFEPVFREPGKPLRAWVRECLAAAAAEVLFTHARHDLHPQHDDVHAAMLRALRGETFRKYRPSRWYNFDTYYLTRVPEAAPVLTDITSEFTGKCRALRCHRSQKPRDLVRMARYMNGLHGMQLGTRYAEAFYPFPLMGGWPALRDLP